MTIRSARSKPYCTMSSDPREVAFTPGAAPTTGVAWWRCTSPRSDLFRSQRIRRLRRRIRPYDRQGSLCRRRYGESTSQLHARGLHQRRHRRRGRGGFRQRSATCPTTTSTTSSASASASWLRLVRSDGIPPHQIEYKTRRLVNDYLQPPKVTTKMLLAQQRFAEIREDLEQNMVVRDSHELMRALEASSILDCAEMAATASLFRTESRWGLYHNRVDYPEKNDADWFCHTLLQKSAREEWFAPSARSSPTSCRSS